MRPARTGLALLIAASLPVLGTACGDPAGPVLPDLDIVVAAGDGQFGAVGQVLSTQLHAVVRTSSSGTPRRDVTVLWEVMSGDASFTTSAAAATDSTGSTYATVRLGMNAGEVKIRVKAVEQTTASASFTVYAVDTPRLDALGAVEASAGDTLTLAGMNFHPTAGENAVLFSGIRGVVVSGSSTELRVMVPPCLPTRTVQVQVLLGALASESRSLAVLGGTELTELDPGEVLDLAQPSAPGCVRLPGVVGTSYLAVPFSAGLTATARHQGSFRGLTSQSGLQTWSARAAQAQPLMTQDPQGAWDRRLRTLEAGMMVVRDQAAAPPAVAARVEVPSVGDERSFKVLNADAGFDNVDAVVRYVGSQAVLYVDKRAPAGGFTVADLAAFSDTFDEMIHPTVSGAFGSASDLDQNQRIVILFTPAVNSLTPKGSNGGFVGGFFYGLDLLKDQENSNGGEIFYALVPDPAGEFSMPHPKSQVLELTPAILAHEFQHMIHFNERRLVARAEGQEALWLSEGMAQMAEELVARAFLAVGDAPTAADFRDGNLTRARRYLADPLGVSLIVTTGQGSLEERGGGWLYVLYLVERFGASILSDLTATTRTGVDNVTFQTGERWDDLLADWWAALYLDGRGAFAPELGFGDFRVRDILRRTDGTEALWPAQIGGVDFQEDLSFWSSSARHYILRPPSGGSLVVRLGGEGGGTASASSELRLRIVRLF